MRLKGRILSRTQYLGNTGTIFKPIVLAILGFHLASSLFKPVYAQQQCTSNPVLAGYVDYDFSGGGVTSEPTEQKPESKLWYNDGFWWGVMWEPVSDVYTIHRLDLTNQCWEHVGPNVDDRGRSSQDVIWDASAGKLYISSRAKLSIQASESTEARLYRFSYISGSQTYSLDAGFPVIINGAAKTLSLVITKDSTGKLWATWTDSQKVMVNRTDGNDANWGTAFILPTQQNDLELDPSDSTRTADMSSVIAFGGDKIGILWGNQNPVLDLSDRKYFFSIHNDSDADSLWQPREDVLPALTGQGDNNPVADDHINVHAISNHATLNGTIFAALKLSFSGTSNPRIVVAKRDVGGSWSHATFGTGADDHTRPILVCDTDSDSIFVLAKSGSGDGIFMKSAHFNSLTFSSGFGRPFIQSLVYPDANNPTSTKQCLDASTGIVILASDKDNKFYLHNYHLSANSSPVAVDNNVVTQKEAAAVFDVLTNDIDSDGTIDTTTVAIVTSPANGTASVNATNGEITYTPNAGYTGPDTLRYTVKDDNKVSAFAATVIVKVNDPPVAVADSGSTGQQTPIVIDVVSNDTDSDGTIDATTVAIASAASNGSTSVDGTTGAITYTPNAAFSGQDSFTYTVDDNDGGTSNAGTVIIGVNNPPTVQNDAANTNEDTPVVIVVLANDSDSNDAIDSTTVAVTTSPTNGSVSVNSTNGEVTYTPNADFFGEDGFTYTVKDDLGATSDTATVDVAVASVNDDPVAVDDDAQTNTAIPLAIDVLANDSDVDGTLDPSTVVVASAPSNGSTSVNSANGEITYTSNGGFSGTDTFTYTVNDDGGGTSNAATVSVNVNNPPVTAADTASTPEDFAVVVDILANDTDIDGTILPGTVSITAGVSNGSTSIDSGTGAITYTPNANFFGVDSLTYTVLDDDSTESNPSSVTINVTDVNDTPVAADDAAGTDQGLPVAINVLANDSDVDGTLDSTTVAIVGTPGNGSVSVDGTTGEITYTPNPGFSGSDTLTYTVQDDAGATSNTATVTISTNSSPVAVDDIVITAEDIPVQIVVLSNDFDNEGSLDASSVEVVDAATGGTTSVNSTTGVITYVPLANFFGTYGFTYRVYDDQGIASNVATVTVIITDVNDAPIAQNDVASTVTDSAVVISVLANDSDVDGTVDPFTVLIGTQPNNGTAVLNSATGDITYTSNSGFSGADALTYTVRDNDAALSNEATVSITVGGSNFPPVATDDNAFTVPDTAVAIAVLANDSDSDGSLDVATLSIVSSPGNGTATPISGGGQMSLTFEPTDDAYVQSNQPTKNFGSDDFIQARTSSEGEERNSYLKFNIGSLGGPIVSAKIRLYSLGNTAEGGSVYLVSNNYEGTSDPWDEDNIVFDNAPTISGTPLSTVGLVSSDEIVEFDITSAISGNGVISFGMKSFISNAVKYRSKESVTPPQLVVTFSVSASVGEILYSPNAGFVGTDNFTYRVNDDEGVASNVATVNVTVSDANESPVANGDVATTPEDSPVGVSVLANDSDLDGALNPTTLAIVGSSSDGSTSIDVTTGIITYTPSPDFFGSDNFSYTVQDDDGAVSNAATVTVTVTSVNDSPVATNDSATIPEDQPVVIEVLTNDSDVDGTLDPTSCTIVTPPSNGSATVDGVSGDITYTPNANFFGTDTFTYTIADNDGGVSNIATVTVNVADVNDLPVAANDSSGTSEDAPVVIAVLSNDSDVDGALQPGSVTIVTAVTNGSTTIDIASGAVTYTPNSNFFGSDTFTYTVADDDGGVSNVATVTVNVSDDNDLPVAVDDAVSTPEDSAVVVQVLTNDSDVDGTLQPGSVTIVTAVTNGSTTIDITSGAVTYTPNSNFFGSDTFTYTVADDDGGVSNVATVTVNVSDDNDLPVAANDSSGTSEDAPVVIAVLSNDSDVDGALQPGSVTIVTAVTNGSTTIDIASGAVTYTPNSNFFGSDTFTYTVADDDGGVSNVATVTVNVSDDNDLPVAVDDAVSTPEDSAVVVQVLTNDSDVDGTLQPGSVTIVTAVTNGSTTIDITSGAVTYTPNSNFFGSDTFTYTVADDDGGVSNVATVTVDVSDDNDLPVAVDDAVSTPEDSAVVVQVLTNDSDVDGTLQPGSVTIVTAVTNGSTTIDITSGAVTYTPNSDFFGSDTFTYTVADDDGGVSNVATVTVNVSDDNDLPVAVDDAVSTPEDSAVVVQVLTNDSDVDGTLQPGSVTIVTAVTNGSTTIDITSGAVTYTPNSNFFGSDTFTYTVADDDGGVSNVATVTVNVSDDNDLPVAVDDAVSTPEDSAVVVQVLTNDSDVDGTLQPGSVTIVTAVTNGSTTIDITSGAVTYTPNSNFFGSDTFTYTVADDDGGVSNVATVTVNVSDDNDLPVAANDSSGTSEDAPVCHRGVVERFGRRRCVTTGQCDDRDCRYKWFHNH